MRIVSHAPTHRQRLGANAPCVRLRRDDEADHASPGPVLGRSVAWRGSSDWKPESATGTRGWAWPDRRRQIAARSSRDSLPDCFMHTRCLSEVELGSIRYGHDLVDEPTRAELARYA